MPPSRRAVRIASWVFWPMGLILAFGVIAQGSYAAFTAKVSNTGNSLEAGRVILGDDDMGGVLFSVTGLRPGSSASRCIAVTSSGTLSSSVKLYATDATSTRNLSTYISLVITQGTSASYGSCTGFAASSSNAAVYSGTLAAFVSSSTSYGTGAGIWTPTGTANETRSYLITYTLSMATPDTSQGGTASLGLVWETQNT